MLMRDEVRPLVLPAYGETCRFEIPIKSLVNLRKVAEELRGLAQRLEYLSRYPLETPEQTIIEVRRVISHTNKRMQTIRGRGRPKKGRQFRDPYNNM